MNRRELITGASAAAIYSGLANNAEAMKFNEPQGILLFGRGVSSPLALAPVGNRNQSANAISGALQYHSTMIVKRTGRKPVSGIWLRCPWFYVDANSVETLVGNGVTGSASIEYPLTVFHQCTVSGSATITITDGTSPDFDLCAVNIPANTDFRVHWHGNAGAAGKHAYNCIASTNRADGLENGVATDKTMVGGETAAGSSAPGGTNAFSPIVLGMVAASEPSYIGIGDSIMAGSNLFTGALYASALDAYANIGWFERLIHGNNGYSYLNLARGSTAAFEWRTANAMDKRLSLIRGLTNSFAINAIGHNDNGVTPSVTKTSMGVINTQMNTVVRKTIGATLTPYTSSTDSWATTGNQTIASTDNAAMNANVVSGTIAGQTGYIDLMAAFKSGGAAGEVWRVGPETTDGVHPNVLSVNTALSLLSVPL